MGIVVIAICHVKISEYDNSRFHGDACYTHKLNNSNDDLTRPSLLGQEGTRVIDIESRNPKLSTAEGKNVLLAHMLTEFRR